MNDILLEVVTYFSNNSLDITEISCNAEKFFIKYRWTIDLNIHVGEHQKNLQYLKEKYTKVKWIDFAAGNLQIALQ